MIDIAELIGQLKLAGGETRSIELKTAANKDALLGKLVKAVVAHANQEDGGHILVGISNNLDIIGLSESQLATFRVQTFGSELVSYCDPEPPIAIKTHEYEGKKILGIHVGSCPSILCCKKSIENEVKFLEIYVRKEGPKSERPSGSELRELIERVTFQRLSARLAELTKLGLIQSPKEVHNQSKAQREEAIKDDSVQTAIFETFPDIRQMNESVSRMNAYWVDSTYKDISSYKRTVVMQPANQSETARSIYEDKRLLTQCSVSRRGWDFPHTPSDLSDYHVKEESISFSTEPGRASHIEHWEMARREFAYTSIIKESLAQDHIFSINKPDGTGIVFSLTECVYSFSEIFEFAWRCGRSFWDSDSIALWLSFDGIKGSVMGEYKTTRRLFHSGNALRNSFSTHVTIVVSQGLDLCREQALKTCQAFFSEFDLTIEYSILKEIQDEFYGLTIGRDFRSQLQ